MRRERDPAVNSTLEMAPSSRRSGPLRLARESLTWRSAAYLLLHFPLGLAYFVGLTVLLSVSAGTVIVWVGVLGLALSMILWRTAAKLERHLAKAAFGVDIPDPHRPLPRGVNLFAKWKAMATDPATGRTSSICSWPSRSASSSSSCRWRCGPPPPGSSRRR
jgi:hypothetical protein